MAKEKQPSQALPCIICGKSLENVGVDEGNQPYDGLAFSSHGHYGSTSFDPMDGSYLEISICDECLVKKAKKKEVFRGQDRRLVLAKDQCKSLAIPGVVGWQGTVKTLDFWDSEKDYSSDELILEADKVGSESAGKDIIWNSSVLKDKRLKTGN